MGFITDKFRNEKYKYISLGNIILYVQSLDEDKPSLAETALFILKKYETSYSFIFDNIYSLYHLNSLNEYRIGYFEYQGLEKPFYYLLNFVAENDDFENVKYINYGHYTNIHKTAFMDIEAANMFLYECGLYQDHDLPKFIRELENKNSITINEITNTTNNQNINECTNKISELKSITNYSSETEIADFIRNATAEITRLQNELATYELIKRHRERAAGFNALIETLEYHASEYDSDKQPLKKKVAETFNRKAQLKEDNRRGEEAARILGLPEKNS